MPLRELTSRQLFLALLYGYGGFYLPLSVLFGILSLVGVIPAKLNQQLYYGLPGLTIYVVCSPFVVFILTVSTWIFVAPGWKLARLVWARMSPMHSGG